MNVSVIKRLLTYTKKYKLFLVLGLFSAVVSVSMTLLAPVLVGQAIDLMLGIDSVNFVGLIRIAAILVAVIIISCVFNWITSFCTNNLAHKTAKDLRVQAFCRLGKMPLKYIDTHSHGDIISRITNDLDNVSDGLLQGINQLFTGIVTIIGTLLFMLTISPTIALVVVLITPLSLFVATTISKYSSKMFKEQQATQGELSGYILEMIGNQKVVKTFGFEQQSQKKFDEINARLYTCGVKAQFYSAMSNPCTRFVNGIVYAGVGIIGALSAISGRLTIGQISCFLSYANQYTKPFNEVTAVITQLQTAIAAAERVFALLDTPTEPSDDSTAIEMTACNGNVTLENVCFSYSEQRKLIENLSLFVNSGEVVAIVGPTGCGKTTIINLLMRFYDIESGKIMLDGINTKNITKSTMRTMYGMVLQDTWLFSGTVRDNIAYAKPNATLEMVIAAAKSVHAHNFIMQLPNGYDTLISQNGDNISSGQKQLLCIARVMLFAPPMLILDEATSSIDTLTELRIQKAFRKMMKGRTSFVVAHRLSTIKEADKILVMDKGKIIEQGTHENLLLKQGFYAKLYHS